MSSVPWRIWLAQSQTMSNIVELTTRTRGKHLSVALNSQGSFTANMNMLDPVTAFVQEHSTCIVAYRAGSGVWSGPIFQTKEDSHAGADVLSITANGWYQNLNQRILHTGTEFATMLGVPFASSYATATYSSLGTESATQLAYANQPSAQIAFDLLARANADVPTFVSPGILAPGTPGLNLTLQQFQNVGQQISRLTNIEAGFDFDVHPLTREFNTFYDYVTGTVIGRGSDRGRKTLFTYPGNCVSAGRSRDGTKTANRIEAIGSQGVGRADDIQSQASLGLFEANDSLSDVVDTNILIAYANAEVVARRYPWTNVIFQPKAVGPGVRVPQPFSDYYLGDVVYGRFQRGPRFQIGTGAKPQALRCFGLEIDIDDMGIEKVTQVKTQMSA